MFLPPQKSLFATSERQKRCHLQHLWCFADMRHLFTPACRESPWIKGFSLKSLIASKLQGGLNWWLTARKGGGTGFDAGAYDWCAGWLRGLVNIWASNYNLRAPFGRFWGWLEPELQGSSDRFTAAGSSWFWDVQQRQGHLAVSSKGWISWWRQWSLCGWMQLALGPSNGNLQLPSVWVCLCQMPRPVVRSGKCNSYLPACTAQTPTHSCSPHSQYHTQHLSVCVSVRMFVYVCVPARLHTRIDLYFRACERGNLRCFSFPVLTSTSAC